MSFRCSSNYTKRLDTVRDFIRDDDVHYACVFIDSKARSMKVLKELERKLDESLLKIDVVHVHGSLDKNEKYWFIRIFCAGIDEADMRAKILLATSAGDVGVDNHLVKFVLNLGWSKNLCAYFQRRSRAGRNPDMDAECLQLGSVRSFVSNMMQIFNPKVNVEDDADPEESITGFNSAITPPRRAKYRSCASISLSK